MLKTGHSRPAFRQLPSGHVGADPAGGAVSQANRKKPRHATLSMDFSREWKKLPIELHGATAHCLGNLCKCAAARTAAWSVRTIVAACGTLTYTSCPASVSPTRRIFSTNEPPFCIRTRHAGGGGGIANCMHRSHPFRNFVVKRTPRSLVGIGDSTRCRHVRLPPSRSPTPPPPSGAIVGRPKR